MAISAPWTIQEEDPALIRYCADDGVEIVSPNIFRSVTAGGPVRTYSITGDFFVKDPYCQVDKAIISTMEEIAAKTAAQPPCAAGSSKFVVPPLGRKRLGRHGMNLRLTLAA